MVESDEINLVIARLQVLPAHLKVSIGAYGAFDKNQLIAHVKQNDEIGKAISDVYMSYLRSFKELADQ